jgi:voltage-gated potassium channel
VGTLVGVLGVAIFAVPAGLIGSGLMDAMEKERDEKEIDSNYARLRKAFRREVNKSLRTHLNTLPDKGGEKLAKLNFVPQFVPLSRVQIRQGIDIKEVFDVCEKYPKFRIKNLAEAISDEDNPEDRFMVSTFPMNTSYGCCIDRASKVTIVCTAGFSEVGTGWFSYYLAKLGGFNYVCKDLEVDPDELDSFYNMSDEPLYEKKTRAEYTSKDKQALLVLKKKEARRADFLSDIKGLNRGDDSWIIMISAILKTSENPADIHLAYGRKDGTDITVNDMERFKQFSDQLAEIMRDYGMATVKESTRYPLLKKNLAYRLREKEGLKCNVFALRPSTRLMIFDVKKMLYAYRMASIISETFDDGKGIITDDVTDFQNTGFGFAENA